MIIWVIDKGRIATDVAYTSREHTKAFHRSEFASCFSTGLEQSAGSRILTQNGSEKSCLKVYEVQCVKEVASIPTMLTDICKVAQRHAQYTILIIFRYSFYTLFILFLFLHGLFQFLGALI